MTECATGKTGEYPSDIPQFSKPHVLKDNNYNNLHLARKHPQIYVLGYYLFLEVFLDLQHSRKTVHFSERIMSADKYPSLFPRQMEAIDYLVYCG